MKNKFAQSLLWATAALFIFWGCTKSTPFGSDLLEDQVADYNAVDIPINCTVIREDSVTTSDRNNSFEYFFCGQLNDEEFGVTTSEIFAQFFVGGIPKFLATDKLDSVCLILPYYASAVYGDTTAYQNLQVFQLDDTILPSRNYFSVNSIPANTAISDQNNFMPRPRTYKKILDTAAATTKLPHLQVNLSSAFGQKLMALDSPTMANKFSFWRAMKGLKIVSTNSGTDKGCMLAFNLNSTNCFIRLYYSVNDTTHKSVNYAFNTAGSNKFMRFSHSYTGTNAGAAIDQVNPDLIYLQGVSGLKLKVEFPTAAADFDKILVNKADLEMTMASDAGYLPINQLVTYDKVDTTFVVTSDVQYALSVGSNSLAFFGGTPQKKADIYQYHLNMSKRFQKIVDADPADAEAKVIYLNVFPQRGSAARNIIYGVNNASYPMKLRLKYTKL
jgi:hypothetical protein